MCELTFCSLISREENVLLGMFLTRIGASKHDDGTGYLTKDSAWKTSLAANRIINYGEILEKEIYETKEYDPIAFHIRSATRGISVTDENAHPFIGKHFSLMHNGTLEFDDEEDDVNFFSKAAKTSDSDSLKFLGLMDEIREKEPNLEILHVVNKAMEKCSGKFAFIIKEASTGDFYIVRGDTAELWISEYYILSEEELKEIEKTKKSPPRESDGYVINTSKETLREGILQFFTTYQLFCPDYTAYFTNPALLKKETMFKAEVNGLVEVGEVKEKRAYKNYNYHNQASRVGQSQTLLPVSSLESHKELDTALSLSKNVSSWLKDASLSASDFQLILGFLFGVSLLELTEEDVNVFLSNVSPALLSTAPKRFRKHVRKLLNGEPFPRYLYTKFDLEFPWVVNEKEKVVTALDYHIKAKEK